MRQYLGDRKLRKYAAATGLDVIYGTARGNTGHRVDLYVRDGTIWYYWPKTGRLEKEQHRTWSSNVTAPKETA